MQATSQMIKGSALPRRAQPPQPVPMSPRWCMSVAEIS